MNQRRYKPALDRTQRLLLPERVEDYVGENHQIRAVDGSFFKADASKASIQTEDYVDRELERIERKIEEYQQALEEQDAADEEAHKQDTGNDEVLREKIEEMRRRQAEKRDLKARMERSGDRA